MTAATCYGKAVCGEGARCGNCRTALDAPAAYWIAPGIPARRYGIVPPPPEPEWEIEPADPHAPRTIAEYGGTLVLLAGIVSAALLGWLLYLR